MTDLMSKIHATFAADSDLVAALTSGLFDTEATQGTDYPYGTYLLVSNMPHDMASTSTEDALIQFSLYSDSRSRSEIDDMYTKLIAVFGDKTPVRIAGASEIFNFRRDISLRFRKDGIWNYFVQYRVTITP